MGQGLVMARDRVVMIPLSGTPQGLYSENMQRSEVSGWSNELGESSDPTRYGTLHTSSTSVEPGL